MAENKKKKRKKRRLKKWVVAVIWLLVLVLFAVSVIAIVKTKKKRMFTIGSEKVYADEVSFYALQCAFNYHLSNVDMLYEYYDGATTYEEQYKNEVKQAIVDTKVMYLFALKKGIRLSKEDQGEIAEEVADTLSNIGDYLEKFGVDEALVTRVLTEQKYAGLLKETVVSEQEDVNTYFHVYNLLFPTVKTNADGTIATNADGSLVPENEADKQKQYALAMKAIELSKTDMTLEAIAKELGVTETSGDIYGDIENYDSQKYLEEIHNMSEGEVSQIVETIYGYNVFCLISKDDKEYAAQMMNQEEMFASSEAYESQLEKWKQAADIDERKLEGDAWEAFTMKDYVIKR